MSETISKLEERIEALEEFIVETPEEDPFLVRLRARVEIGVLEQQLVEAELAEAKEKGMSRIRVWMRSGSLQQEVAFYPIHPGIWFHDSDDASIRICRKHASRLLRGTGKRLPRHGSDTTLEIELTTRVVRSTPRKLGGKK